ncbi:tetratricopeptide repeat protein [Bartonella sp. F02]|uniref:tetratricopeptide repeat protein n=1 Tax=Bartonella sp. F02 TaxID=2967262 RepID=UPI0022A9727D|nr:tetratricopeptide repeat protein [Bartonella sp. F02]MCZ2328445.1 tetratricopeptide repeat protein [Bartonella sp. F02]
MSYDSFIAEVNAEFRQEKVLSFWKRYGFLIITGIIIFVSAVIVYQVYHHMQMNKAGRVSDTLIESFDLADSRRFDEAMKQLEKVKESDFGVYPFLARLREASLLMEQGAAEKSVEVFDVVAADEKAPQILRKVAQIRAAYILVDIGTFEDVKKRVGNMANDIDFMRMSAREALGLAAYKENKIDEALYYFRKISEENALELKITDRAKIMLEFIQAEGKANKE